MEGYTVYKSKELEQFQSAIEKAKQAWREASVKEYQRTGDSGSCIMGDGIYAFVVPPRCRKPQKVMLIRSSSVACAQGSLHYEACYKVALEMLKEAGLEAHYDYGRMD